MRIAQLLHEPSLDLRHPVAQGGQTDRVGLQQHLLDDLAAAPHQQHLAGRPGVHQRMQEEQPRTEGQAAASALEPRVVVHHAAGRRPHSGLLVRDIQPPQQPLQALPPPLLALLLGVLRLLDHNAQDGQHRLELVGVQRLHSLLRMSLSVCPGLRLPAQIGQEVHVVRQQRRLPAAQLLQQAVEGAQGAGQLVHEGRQVLGQTEEHSTGRHQAVT